MVSYAVMRRLRSSLVLLLVACAVSHVGAATNIVFILADDMGYGDVAALNPDSTIPTPHLDRLAKEGMTFTDAHSGSAVCTPTRYGVLTGRYCWRGRLKRGVLNGYGKPLIEEGRETVGSFLQKQGYATACVGKWHLGLGFVEKTGGQENEFDYAQPLTDGAHTRGFDYSYIIPASLDFPPYVYIKDGKVTGQPDRTQRAQGFPAYLRKGPIGSDFQMEDALDHLLGEATSYIEKRENEEKPFFLYFPLTAPHKPVLPHKRFRGKSKLGPYGDFVMQVDATVGGVLEALDETGQTENTLIIYTSDNGSFMYRAEEGEPGHVIDVAEQSYQARHHTANGVYRRDPHGRLAHHSAIPPQSFLANVQRTARDARLPTRRPWSLDRHHSPYGDAPDRTAPPHQ